MILLQSVSLQLNIEHDWRWTLDLTFEYLECGVLSAYILEEFFGSIERNSYHISRGKIKGPDT